MKARILYACTLLFLAAGAAPGQHPDQDPIGQSLFAPELVTQHPDGFIERARQHSSHRTRWSARVR